MDIQNGDDVLILAIAEFGSGKNKKEIIASDANLTGLDFNFKYHVKPFPNYAGIEQMIEITLSEAAAVPSWDEVRKLYANIFDPGVPK